VKTADQSFFARVTENSISIFFRTCHKTQDGS